MREKYKWINEPSMAYLNDGEKGYLLPGETPEDRFEMIAQTIQEVLPNTPSFKKDFLKYLDIGMYALSTPFITSIGRKSSLPFSCSNQHIGDSLGEIAFAKGESAIMTKVGKGCSGYIDLRGKNTAITNSSIPSPGSLYFAEGFNQLIKEVNQGVRRGYMALYWDMEHQDIMEVLEIQRDNNPIDKLNYGVCISREFLARAERGELSIVTNDKGEFIPCRDILLKYHESKFMTGLPYTFFKDNVNEAKPDVYKDNNLEIKSSNLCTEILEVSDEKYSFVCDIAAMNATMLEHPEFKKAVKVLAYALDGLHTIYQRALLAWKNSPKKEDNYKWMFLEKAYNSSHDFRDIGVGCTGYHTALQIKNLAFESMEAKFFNTNLFKTIQEATKEASKELALDYGTPKMLEGYGRRNCLMNAVAPNTSSAFILGQVSQGIEPIFSNYYIKDIAGGKHVIKNSQLERVLEELGINNRATWKSIGDNDGSVQHLKELSEQQKNVFKTFQEIAPLEILIQASARQKFIDQGQSLNLMINDKVGYKEANKLLYKASELGIKTLYYQHGTNAAQQLRKSLLECDSCAG
jgi:ribonucleoside-diphosphate reductase alpha chain